MIYLRRIIVSLLLLINSSYAGEYADAFLLASIHPQVYSLGSSTVATDLFSGYAFNNPAALLNGPSRHIGLVYDQFGGLSSNYSIEVKYPVAGEYDLGITLIHSSIDDLLFRPNLFELTPLARRDSVLTSANDETNIIPYREDAAFLTVGREYEFNINLGWRFFKIPCRVPLGVSVKYIDKLLFENRGLGSGIDVGGQFFFSLAGMTDVLVNTEFSFGLFVSDILDTPVYWTTVHQDAIKRNFTAGYAIKQDIPKYFTVITFSASSQSRYPNVAQVGLDIRAKDLISLRAGHDGYTNSFGLGISLKKFIIDYSFSQHELTNMQKIGINYSF